MNKKLHLLLAPLVFLAGCQTVAQDINKFQTGVQGGLNKLQGGLGVHSNIKEMHGIRFEAKSCELTEFRTILCRMVVTSKHQDRTLDLLSGGYTKVQDDTGKSYPIRISFGESAEGGQRQSVLIADTPYNVTLTAENISSRATKVRAIDITRMDIRGVGSIKLVLAHPPMIASQGGTNGPASARSTPARPRPGLPGTTAKPTATIASTPKTKSPQESASSSGVNRTATAAWQTVGLWDYDGDDAQHLAQGFVLRNGHGSALGQAWEARLELKDHKALPPRKRTLWPVMISAGQKKICANYPGYPTYPVFVDMPGTQNDGMYLVSYCQGGARG